MALLSGQGGLHCTKLSTVTVLYDYVNRFETGSHFVTCGSSRGISHRKESFKSSAAADL